LTIAEYALAFEAAQLDHAFELVGLDFDARTFVAMRILESSVAEGVDLEHALGSAVIRGLIRARGCVERRAASLATRPSMRVAVSPVALLSRGAARVLG
jgi:hypothetical protein